MRKHTIPAFTRRRFLQAASAGAVGLLVWRGDGAEPMDHALASFDREMEEFMQVRGVPGGALAILRKGRLIYARGYGLADRAQQIPVQATSRFRLASVSKPITGVAVLRLVQQGKLKLDQRAFELLPITPLPGQKPDPRLARITIRQLLQHTAGWDRDKSGDPMFMSEKIARACGVPRPADARSVIKYMLGQPLDYDPGTRHVYSNFGYCVLGRIIEQVTGQTYEAWVNKDVLAPSGIRQMRIGRSLAAEAAPGEVRYYTADNRQGRSVFDNTPARVPAPYGTFHLEAMDAHGGWIGSAVDLMRLVAALERPISPLLTPESFVELVKPPPAPVARKPDGSVADAYYGCGWMVRPTQWPAGFNLWHMGSLPGTATILVRLSNGLAWTALFNQRREQKDLPDGDIDAALHRAAAAVRQWPSEDLFGRYR